MKRVLIIKLGALGDVVIASAHIERIVSEHPNDDVFLLTAPAFESLFAGHARLCTRAFPRKGLRAMIEALAWCAGRRFDVVYDLQGSERSALLALATRAKRRVGMGLRFPYTHHIPIGETDGDEHSFARLNRLLECAGLPPAEERARLAVDDAARRRVDEWLSGQGLDTRPFVLMHAGSSARWPSKRWPRESFGEIARRLAGSGLETVWVGADEDAPLNAALARVTGIDATGCFSIPELCALAARARLALANDSGPMHVMAAAGIPVYAFFGPTNWRRSHALGQAQRVLRHPVPCSPCHLPVCPPERGHRCLRDLPPATVFPHLGVGPV